MRGKSLYHVFQRCRTLLTDRITALPIVVLMPHSACNCRCVMCDIWKDNKNLKQLTSGDVRGLLASLRKFGTRQVAMSGGEALLNTHFFTLCRILKSEGIAVSLLSTGLSVKQHAAAIVEWVDDLVLSLDGDEALHDAIRNVPGAFRKLREGVERIHSIRPDYRITARTVIQRLNFRQWPAIIGAARQLGMAQISFLPADVTSQAFNRQTAWSGPRQQEVLPAEDELPALREMADHVIGRYQPDFDSRFIAESPSKIGDIYRYYAAHHGWNGFPSRKCNAPWVSAVIEADGSVRPCFFHDVVGNIREASLAAVLNSPEAVGFRKSLDMGSNPTCVKCVCALNVSPWANA